MRDDLSHVLELIVIRTLAMVRCRGLLEEKPCVGLASVQAIEAVQKALPEPCHALDGTAGPFALSAEDEFGAHVSGAQVFAVPGHQGSEAAIGIS